MRGFASNSRHASWKSHGDFGVQSHGEIAVTRQQEEGEGAEVQELGAGRRETARPQEVAERHDECVGVRVPDHMCEEAGIVAEKVVEESHELLLAEHWRGRRPGEVCGIVLPYRVEESGDAPGHEAQVFLVPNRCEHGPVHANRIRGERLAGGCAKKGCWLARVTRCDPNMLVPSLG